MVETDDGRASGRAGLLRRLSRRGGRLRRPGTGELPTCLVVVDVDLERGVTVLPSWTPLSGPPEGLHALVWFRGAVVDELVEFGDPDSLLPGLQARARLGWELRADRGSPSVTSDTSGLTVIVCTRERPELLERCLASLHGSVATAEVLVVDNAPATGMTREVVDRHPGVRYVIEPRRGISWARNRGLLESHTPLAAFVDDDVQVHAGWAAAIETAFAATPEATAVTGLVAPAELATPAQVLFEAAGGFGRGLSGRRLRAASGSPAAVARAVFHVGAMGTGANMAFRRDRVVALGGFDTALGAGTPTAGGDDHDMLCRLLLAGDLVIYEPRAVVRHRHRPTMGELRDQRRADGTGSAAVLLGAGRRLTGAHRWQWRLVALRWFTRTTVLGTAGSVLRPAARPAVLVRATLGGWLSGVGRDLYGQAQVQARREAAAHPREPRL